MIIDMRRNQVTGRCVSPANKLFAQDKTSAIPREYSRNQAYPAGHRLCCHSTSRAEDTARSNRRVNRSHQNRPMKHKYHSTPNTQAKATAKKLSNRRNQIREGCSLSITCHRSAVPSPPRPLPCPAKPLRTPRPPYPRWAGPPFRRCGTLLMMMMLLLLPLPPTSTWPFPGVVREASASTSTSALAVRLGQ